jgi:hypothetical protein
LPGYANQHRNAPGAISGAVALKARGEL